MGSELGIAPYGQLIAIQVYSLEGDVRKSFVRDRVAALDLLVTMLGEYALVAVNVSISSRRAYGSTTDCDEDEAVEEGVAASNLVSKDVAVIASSGNRGHRALISRPACHSWVTSVSGVDSEDRVTESANVADFLDFYAPGWAVVAATKEHGPQAFNGTSYASPIVAGLLGLRLAEDRRSGLAFHLHGLGREGVMIRDDRSDATTSDKPRIPVP